eukprot:8518448-Pyramimonas_sp.AAC.1
MAHCAGISCSSNASVRSPWHLATNPANNFANLAAAATHKACYLQASASFRNHQNPQPMEDES